MKNTYLITIACVSLMALAGCKKDDSLESYTNLTIESLSGTYGLKALIWKTGIITINVYDQLEDCEKDDLVRLNSDKTINFIDAGILCSPSSNYNATWDLKGDSLFLSSSGITSKIQSFDGKILILTGTPPNEPGTTATTTLEKQ